MSSSGAKPSGRGKGNAGKDLPLNERKGDPLSPSIAGIHDAVLVRYIYDGGALAQGRLCKLVPKKPDAVMASEVLRTLASDGVDFSRFFACVYETAQSTGGWIPILTDIGVQTGKAEAPAEDCTGSELDSNFDGRNLSFSDADIVDVAFPFPDVAHGEGAEHEGRAPGICARRVDVKLFRRRVDSREAAQAEQAATPAGKLVRGGFLGIGVVGAKTSANIGTLWRSALQLGAAFIFTVGARYKNSATDTVNAPNNIPLFELDDWAEFVRLAPRGARWVAVEFGGTPLEQFEHPSNAIYLLGSEDAGLPKSVLRACHEVVSLSAEKYASYNVAIAGSLVMYDRMVKRRAAQNDDGAPSAAAGQDGGVAGSR